MAFCNNREHIDVHGKIHGTAMLKSFVTPFLKHTMLKIIIYSEATAEVHSSDMPLLSKCIQKWIQNIKSSEDCHTNENAEIYMPAIYMQTIPISIRWLQHFLQLVLKDTF